MNWTSGLKGMIFRTFNLNINIGKKLQMVNIKTLKLSVFIFIVDI